MFRWIAFLRAINVGGRRLKMDELRTHFEEMGEELGFGNVETFIASGNVIFETPTPVTVGGADNTSLDAERVALEQALQQGLEERLGYWVDVFLRTNGEIADIRDYLPFDAQTMQQAQALNVGLVAAPLDAAQIEQLSSLRTEIDDFHTHNREIYWICRKKQSESDFSNAVLERALKLKATLRTINTMVRLAAKYPV